MSNKPDLIDFLDSLQPYLDTLQSFSHAAYHFADRYDDPELTSLSAALSFQLEQIEKLCDETTKQFSKGEKS